MLQDDSIMFRVGTFESHDQYKISAEGMDNSEGCRKGLNSETAILSLQEQILTETIPNVPFPLSGNKE